MKERLSSSVVPQKRELSSILLEILPLDRTVTNLAEYLDLDTERACFHCNWRRQGLSIRRLGLMSHGGWLSCQLNMTSSLVQARKNQDI